MESEGLNKTGGQVGDVPNVSSPFRNTDRKSATGGEAVAIQTTNDGRKEGSDCSRARVSDHGGPSLTRDEAATVRGEGDTIAGGWKSNFGAIDVELLDETSVRCGRELSSGFEVDTCHGSSLLSCETLFYDMMALPRPNVPQTNCVVVGSRSDHDGVW